MSENGKKIAVYGKGGIGKSTVSANISYALSGIGYRVLQMGCDPKHDSTKLLLGNSSQTTVLDYIKDKPPAERKIGDVLLSGSNGVLCVEAGGPRPGIGCAGRGILTTFDVLGKLGIDDVDTDFTVYDVLGDVVCGGFAVPMRQEHTDAVYVVTSGEYMAIYAANNIFKGMLNFGTKPRAGGIILNERGVVDEKNTVSRFAEAVGVPVIASIPRDGLFQKAEAEGRTLCELFPDSDCAERFRDLARDIEGLISGEKKLYLPRPLEDGDLEQLIFGKSVSAAAEKTRKCFSPPRQNGISSCASRGAVYQAGRVMDLPIIVHGPAACGYVMSHTQDNHYLSEMAESVRPGAILRNNIWCTDMTDGDSIFGGRDALKRTILERINEGSRTVMIITTCVSGMIGDDINRVIEEIETLHPGVKLIYVAADGNLSGDSDAGRIATGKALIGMIDEKIEPSENKVNLIDPTFMQFNRGRNMEWVRAILRKIDLDIGNRLFEECTLEGIRVCRRNRFNVMVTDDPELRGMFSGKLDIEDMALPQGYADTLEWLKILSEKCGSGSFGEAKSCIEKEYRDAVSKYSGYLGGKRIAFAVSSFFNIDWMIECLSDAGAEICGVYTFRMGRSGKRFATRYRDRIRTAEGMAVNDIASLIKELKPELVIGNSYIARAAGCRFAPNPAESYTHYASVSYLEFITNILRVPESPGWEKWRLPQ